MTGTLAGRCIVVTRPVAQARTLCDAIAARGGEPLLIPVLEIAPPADHGELAAAQAQLAEFDLAFFVSPNAVQHALDYLLDRGDWPASLAVSTVGESSARALRARGLVDVIAPVNGFDTESVLALPAFSATAVAGKRVVIFRGDGGRELLGERLERLGAVVTHVTCYRRFRPTVDIAPLVRMGRRGAVDAVTLTSSEGVRNFVEMLGEEGMSALRDVPVFVPHPRIAGFARDGGFSAVVETGPGDLGLVEAMEARFGA